MAMYYAAPCGLIDTMGYFERWPTPRAEAFLNGCSSASIQCLSSASRFGSPAIALKHLSVMRRNGLIIARRSGRHRYYRLDPKPLEQIAAWAAQFRDVRDRSGHIWRLSQINQRKDT